MGIGSRVAELRRQSLFARPRLSAERARIVTRCYQDSDVESAPEQRAFVFESLMKKKTIWIGEGELIVGERGPEPAVTPTYPEICCHTLSDLDELHNRDKTSYLVDGETRRVYEEEIIPFWQGRSMRDRILGAMTPAWLEAYEAGVFTEFMEQRAPGHTALDDKIYHSGMLDFIARIEAQLESLDEPASPRGVARRRQLVAMRTCARALIEFAERHAEMARGLAHLETDPARRAELDTIGYVCSRVPAHAPTTFHEALQYYWFVHVGVITELNPWDAFNPGHLDQHLAPFYRRDRAAGILTEEHARELLQCFWIKFNNQPAPSKVGVTAAESGTYTDFANINTGGINGDGTDGVNEVTYLILDVIDEMRLLQPSSNIQLSRANPDRFLLRACEIVREGWGQPSIFNADMVIEELLRQGKSPADARAGGTSGCVESGAFGKEAYILTGYFNLPKVLEITLNNGRDPQTTMLIGVETGDPETFEDFDQLLAAFETQLRHFIDIKIDGNNTIERLYTENLPTPFLSLLIDDCITEAADYMGGGARYNTSYIQGVGLATVTDSLSAIAHHVFGETALSMAELLRTLASDYEGQERTRKLLLNRTPRYGNDDDRADDIMCRVFDIFFGAVDGRSNSRGGQHHINLLPTTCHVYFGSVTGATPDGRLAGAPLSEGISPVQGADRKGPTAVLKSASKMDHFRTGGTLLNQKFSPELLEGEERLGKFSKLIRSYFRLGGHHLQFNVINADTLLAAQENPEQYRDLIVRVAGYSDYFCDLNRGLQDEIIARTEHGAD